MQEKREMRDGRISLQEIGAGLSFHKIVGPQLRSPDCPCCGGHKKRWETALSIRDTGDFLLLRCFKCDADWKDLARKLGISNGVGFRTVHVEAISRDKGPFHPEAEVLRKVAAGMFDLLPDGIFPEGRIGDRARIVAEHTLSARRRTPGLRFQPDEAPFSVSWCGKVLRRLGYRVSNETAGQIARLLRSTFQTSRHVSKSSSHDSIPRYCIICKLSSLSNKVKRLLLTSNTAVSAAGTAAEEELPGQSEQFRESLRPNPPPSATNVALEAAKARAQEVEFSR